MGFIALLLQMYDFIIVFSLYIPYFHMISIIGTMFSILKLFLTFTMVKLMESN